MGTSLRRSTANRRPTRSRPRRSQTIDFPALIERAYHDGIRFFLEVGPGASCTRLIGQILRGRPHVAISACRPDRDPLAAILDVLAELISQRLPVDLAGLYRDPSAATPSKGARPRSRTTPGIARSEST